MTNEELQRELTEAREEIAKFGLLEEQLENYKAQWRAAYEKQFKEQFETEAQEAYSAIHRIAASLNLDEYNATQVADAAISTNAALRSRAESLTEALKVVMESSWLTDYEIHTAENALASTEDSK